MFTKFLHDVECIIATINVCIRKAMLHFNLPGKEKHTNAGQPFDLATKWITDSVAKMQAISAKVLDVHTKYHAETTVMLDKTRQETQQI